MEKLAKFVEKLAEAALDFADRLSRIGEGSANPLRLLLLLVCALIAGVAITIGTIFEGLRIYAKDLKACLRRMQHSF